jgi:hypothetical protein
MTPLMRELLRVYDCDNDNDSEHGPGANGIP